MMDRKTDAQAIGRRRFLCGCCVGLAGASVAGRGFAATADVPPVEDAFFHMQAIENDYVRVLKVYIPAGRTASYHRHSIDFAQVTIEAPDRLDYTNIGEPTTTTHPKRGQIGFHAYSTAPLVHQVENVSTMPYHVKGIEILPARSGRFPRSDRSGVAAYVSALENDRVRGWRLILHPGEAVAPIRQAAPGIRFVIDGGDVVESVADHAAHEVSLAAGDFVWQPAGATRALRNVGASTIEVVEFELA